MTQLPDDRQALLNAIRDGVEHVIELTGMTGTPVKVLRITLLILISALIAWLVGLICRKVITPLILRMTAKTEAKWDDALFNRDVLNSTCNIIPAIIVWMLLPMVFYEFHAIRIVVTRITAIYITVMSAKTGITFISSFRLLDSELRTSTQQYLISFIGVLRIVIIFVAAIVTIAIAIGKSPLTLFAGLGATSAVLMLIFKDTITGLVAGVRLTSNSMLHKGDWITLDKAGANGVVEEMSLTTVKVRNFDNTIVTISPVTLVTDSFQNWKGMQTSQGRRVNRKVYYDFHSIHIVSDDEAQSLVDKGYFGKREEIEPSAVNVQLYRRYIERYLRTNEHVNAEMTYMVRQFEATTNGMPLEFYFFLKDKEWKTYEHRLADVMEHIYAVTPDFGLIIYQQYPDQRA